MKVKPKIFGAARFLVEAENEIRAFQKQHEAGGRQVFSKSLDYHLDALKFNSVLAIAGLDDEIKVIESLIQTTNEL